MTDDPARYIREAANDYEARAIVDAWDREDTAARERDRLTAELTATAARPAPQPDPEPEPAPEPTPAAVEPAPPDLSTVDQLLRYIDRR